jgi:hypothetical protein
MTRKHTTKKQQYWPGTNIVKSVGNAFDWKASAQGMYTKAELASIQAYVKSRMNNTAVASTIPTFSKARASGFTNR